MTVFQRLNATAGRLPVATFFLAPKSVLEIVFICDSFDLERELDILACPVDTHGYLRLFNGLKLLVPRSYPVSAAVVILREQLADIRNPLTQLLARIESNRSWPDSFAVLEKTIGLPAFVKATLASVSGVSYLWVFTNMIDQLIFEARLQNDAIF